MKKEKTYGELKAANKEKEMKWVVGGEVYNVSSENSCIGINEGGDEIKASRICLESNPFIKGSSDEAPIGGVFSDCSNYLNVWEWHLRNAWYQPRFERDESASPKEYAQEQFQKLLDMGYSKRVANRIFRAAGPGRATKVVDWVRGSIEALGGQQDSWGEYPQETKDLLDMVLSGTGGLKGFGTGRICTALELMGIPRPPESSKVGLIKFLSGAHQVVLIGLPEEKIEE